MTDPERAAQRFAGLAPGEPMTPRALLRAVGGWLGVAEAVLPSLVFIVAYQVVAIRVAPAPVPREALLPVVLPPLGLAAVFMLIRLARRQRIVTAVGGALGAALSAGLALVSGNANANFVPGLVVNALYGLVFLVSALARRPLIGLVAPLLTGDREAWRVDPARRRVATWLTLLWALLFAVRLAVELPLYLAGDQVVALGIAKIALGLPLYAPLLVLTVVAVEAVRRRPVPGRS